MSEYLFTSESVTEGHPDKVADAAGPQAPVAG
jgi:S-adenosylmethionine synthetase